MGLATGLPLVALCGLPLLACLLFVHAGSDAWSASETVNLAAMTRLLDLPASAVVNLKGPELIAAIRACEGRAIVAETIGVHEPLIDGVTNAELVAAMGADLVLLNVFDLETPQVKGLPPVPPAGVLAEVKRLTGVAVGINLEPVGVPVGRLATAENARLAVQWGAQFLVVTANPGTGARNEDVTAAIRVVSDAVGADAMVIGGRMHGSGARAQHGSRTITAADVAAFVAAGADVVLLPAPGTVPGLLTAHVHALVEVVHEAGKLAMTAIGTSQEGADVDTIRAIALAAKQTGADLHHLGDGGFQGICVPENLLAYSKAIRGVRHTYRRMASSVRR